MRKEVHAASKKAPQLAVSLHQAIFDVRADSTTKAASNVNGTGPASCGDLQLMDYHLAGFYMVRFKASRGKVIYCDFNQNLENTNKKAETTAQSTEKLSPENMKFCNREVKQPCTFLYTDYPDIPQFNLRRDKTHKNNTSCENCVLGPTSCTDLKSIGHLLRGFYFIRQNANKVKIVYCDFNQKIEKDGEKIRMKRATFKKSDKSLSNNTKPICNSFGSRPCSCHYSNSPSILQFEMGNDEITRNAMDENGTGPATCEELKIIGYFLDGFYMLRFDSKTIRTVYCKFNEQLRKSTKKETLNITSSKKSEPSRCYPAFYLKNEERGSTECLSIQQVRTNAITITTSIVWIPCDSPTIVQQAELQWVLLPTEVFQKTDPEFEKHHHICQLKEFGKECLSIITTSKTRHLPARVNLSSHWPKLKDQVWKVNGLEAGQIVNFLTGFCLGYYGREGPLYTKNNCNDRDNNGNFLKALNWSFVAVTNESGGKKCVSI